MSSTYGLVGVKNVVPYCAAKGAIIQFTRALALEWAEGIGGLPKLIARADANLAALESWAAQTAWAGFLAPGKETRSNTSVCLKIADPWFAGLPKEAQAAVANRIASLLEKEGVAFDIGAYRDAPAGLRIWAGATVETADLQKLTPWLDWAFASQKAALKAAA